MKDKVFVDTNILVYFATDKTEKQEKLLTKFEDCEYSFISVQVLNEFNNTCFKKSLLKPEEIEFAVKEYSTMFNVAILNIDTIVNGLKIKQKYNFSYYDSLIVSTALQNECNILYSEDMQHFQRIEDRLTIINPFKE